jgi:DNA-directed RNA polymerase subunit RPC12/RpoP
MQVETLSCDNCGATIELPLSANYATCARCGEHLVVRRGETAHYTEVLDAEVPAPSDGVEGHTKDAKDTEAELSHMRHEMAIMSLDQEWEGKRTQYMVRSRDGTLVEPEISQAITYLLGILALLIYMGFSLITDKYMAGSIGVLGFLIVGLLLVIFAGLAVRRYIKYKDYVAAEDEYLLKRDKLINQRWVNQKPLSS